MREVEGNVSQSKLVKEKGQPKGNSSSHGGSGKIGQHCDSDGLNSYSFESGRTIELRRFEFCRIKIGLSVQFEFGDRSVVRSAVKSFVLEMLKREEAGIEDNKYMPVIEDDTLDLLSSCVNRRLFVGYGLTLKASKEFESHQVDTMEEVPVSSDEIAADISD